MQFGTAAASRDARDVARGQPRAGQHRDTASGLRDQARQHLSPGLGAGLATRQGAVVPGRTFDLARPPAVRGGPLLHAVAALALVAAMEAHAAQLRGVVAVVGQHQGVRAEVRAAGLAGMLEPVINALLGQQALDEGQVAFLRQAGASPL
ncbi:hypothetical protein G6F40_015076 [Rhizopus arrhizus]|nr:hypothetical protein G6F40_015076 [Rhizopus arrhizus]